ncbi:MAG: PQQ-binding-like beta-propeller repeat protein [Akkermansiaceae bacterium]|nr:PQQ-binding-like beta-propeller repeat protein [Akkermansiaceae bacterium]
MLLSNLRAHNLRPALFAAVATLLFAPGTERSHGQVAAPEGSAETTAAGVEPDFEKQSLALRTALHYDPSLDAPLKSLVNLYLRAGREDELIGTYRAHVAQYTDDAGAKAVLIRILRQLNRPEADELIQSATQQHPDNALLQYLLFQQRKRRDDSRALESLSHAIDLETRLARRDAWMEELLEESGEGAGRELAHKQLLNLRESTEHTAESLISLAERMHRHGFDDLALGTLEDAAKKEPGPEVGVEIEILSAKVQGALGARAAAGERLDALMTKLAPDYWRRSEIMNLRVNLLANDGERRRLLTETRERFEASPENETAVLEYAEILAASERRREAAKVLTGAMKVLPASERIEQRCLEILDRIGNPKETEAFLRERLEAYPERGDLRYRLARAEFLLGKQAEAHDDLKMALAGTDAEESERRLLDLARFLRGESLYEEAASIFRQFLESHPERFEVRRELAEVLLVREDRSAARSVLKDLPVEAAAIENLLDLVQFMLKEGFLAEARGALEARLTLTPEHLGLRLQLASVFAKAGDRGRSEEALAAARGLADTPARYTEWLEAGMAVHENFDDAEMFFDAEQLRFLGGEGEAIWTPDRVEMFLSFCEIGERNRLGDRVTQVLRNQLAAGDLPDELRVRLRKLLVKALEKSPDHVVEVEQQLRQLSADDPAGSADYDLRRALLYHTQQRPDLAQETLAAVEIHDIADASLLRAAYPVLVEYGMLAGAKTALEAVTEKDPSDLINWEKRLSLLAAMGSESELRNAIRSLLAGVERVELGAESIRALRLHLLDSHWRSIARQLARADPESLAQTLELLDSVDREAVGTEDRLWALWARAWVLGSLGRADSRDAVIADLEVTARESGEESGSIAFPDGLAISIESALALLREGGDGPALEPRVGDFSEGPLAGLAMDWAFEVEPGAKIVDLRPVPGALFLLDDRGTLYRVDLESGKLLWRERYGLPEEKDGIDRGLSGQGGAANLSISTNLYQVKQQGTSITVQQLVAPFGTATLGPGGASLGASGNGDLTAVRKVRQFAIDPEGRQIVLPFGDRLLAVSGEDGRLLWNAELGTDPGEIERPSANPAQADPDLFLGIDGERVVAVRPAAMIAAAFDRAGGKLLWRRALGTGPAEAEAALSSAGSSGGGATGAEGSYSLNSGAVMDGDRLLVYGRRSLILDTSTGEPIWTFDGGGVRTFPVSLLPVSATAAEAKPGEEPASALGGTPGGVAPRTGMLDHLAEVLDRQEAAKAFLQYRGALVAPAVHWSAARLAGTGAAEVAISENRIFLMSSNGVRRVSLDLPLASRSMPATGVFIGVSGSHAWFLDGATLHHLDFGSGKRFQVLLGSTLGEKETRGLLSGSRLYLMGDRGVLVLNARTGSRIATFSWPEAMLSYADRQGLEMGRGQVPETSGARAATAPVVERVWQGVVPRNPGAPPYCFPFRDRVRGDRLFVLLGNSRVAALRDSPEGDAAPSTPPAPKP